MGKRVQYCLRRCLLAERQMGEFLKEMPKATGGQPYQATGPKSEPVDAQPATLAEIGITKKESSRAQQLADIPAEEFRERIAVAKIDGAARVRTAWHSDGPR